MFFDIFSPVKWSSITKPRSLRYEDTPILFNWGSSCIFNVEISNDGQFGQCGSLGNTSYRWDYWGLNVAISCWILKFLNCLFLSADLPMEEQLRRLQEERTCKVCMDKEVNIVFIPCGHLVVCKECAPSLRKCPICRGLVKGTVRTFLS